MTDLLLALVSIMLPWLLFILPGLFFFDGTAPLIATVARVLVGGLALSILFFSLVVTCHVPMMLAVIVGLLCVGIVVSKLHGKALRRGKYVYLGIIAFLLLIYGLFSLPFLLFHQGLPTGDAQKAIYWAQIILTQHGWPTYSTSFAQLNRDPVDFYTPGLHAIAAALLVSTPGLLTIIGFFSIAAAIAAAVQAAALTSLFITRKRLWWGGVAFALVLSHERFLRYLREPGYHLQNVVGEVLLWGIVLLVLSLMQRWRWKDALLTVLAGLALVLSHQFSSFLAVFMVAAMVLSFAITSPALVRRVWTQYRRYAVGVSMLLVVILIAGLFSSLASKLPDLFTRSPHLLGLLPSPMTYINLANPLYLFAGLAGWLALVFHHYRHKLSTALASSFVAGGVVILLLSVGPLLGVDIPPVRALFYSVVPLSCGVVFLMAFSTSSLKLFSRFVVAVVVLGFCYAGIAHAFTLSHTVRTNATLSPGQQFLIDKLSHTSGATVIDEYNRASASWLLLTHQPLFTRIAADVHQQMDEAGQSVVRTNLYKNQLDFEKIYSLGSSPLITQLMATHDIRSVVGVDGATNWALAHNSALEPMWSADDLTVYQAKQKLPVSSPAPWLLASTTLVRDIGSEEDTYEHVPASIAATRLSDPRTTGSVTYRETTAPFIRLRFNVGDFVRTLWDTNADLHPDMSLQFKLQLVNQPANLSLMTQSGHTVAITKSSSTFWFENSDIVIEDDGFVTLTLLNPTEKMVQLDFMALGLCQNSPC